MNNSTPWTIRNVKAHVGQSVGKTGVTVPVSIGVKIMREAAHKERSELNIRIGRLGWRLFLVREGPGFGWFLNVIRPDVFDLDNMDRLRDYAGMLSGEKLEAMEAVISFVKRHFSPGGAFAPETWRE